MKTPLAQQVLSYAAMQPEGTLLTARSLLHLGSRAGIDKALSRLKREEKLSRPERGIYVLPIKSRFGTRSPAPEKVLAETAKLRGEIIASHGAAAANLLGFTTQVPIQTVFLTSGRSRTLQFGAQHVELQHAPRWQLVHAGHRSGEVIRVLAWAGPEKANQILARLKESLPSQAREELIAARSALPQWVAQSISAALAV